MKFKLFAMILALTVASFAQTATQTAPSPEQKQSTQTDNKKDATACQKMMAGKDGSCCMHHGMAAKDGKDAMSCCAGKNAKSCKKMMTNSKDKMAAMCGDGKCCGKDAKDCCKGDEKNMAMACCGGSKCGMDHHDHGEEMK